MNKPITRSATMRGGAVAALCELAWVWDAYASGDIKLATAICATLVTAGVLYALYGLRRATGALGHSPGQQAAADRPVPRPEKEEPTQ